VASGLQRCSGCNQTINLTLKPFVCTSGLGDHLSWTLAYKFLHEDSATSLLMEADNE